MRGLERPQNDKVDLDGEISFVDSTKVETLLRTHLSALAAFCYAREASKIARRD